MNDLSNVNTPVNVSHLSSSLTNANNREFFENNIHLNMNDTIFTTQCDIFPVNGNMSTMNNVTSNFIDTDRTPMFTSNENGVDMGENPNVYSIINKLRVDNIHRVILAHLNINSLRNKLEVLSDIVANKIDILCLSETKLDATFPPANFLINGYSPPFRSDRSERGGGVMLYIRNYIPSKEFKISPALEHFECILVEINLYKKKWLLGNFYNPNKNQIVNQLVLLGNILDYYYSLYDNVVILGDFNSETTEPAMSDFCETFDLRNLVKEPTCFKSIQNPSCIDLILTNRPNCFKNTITVETGLSDFHKMTVTVLKSFYKKKKPIIISYRDYHRFSNENFMNELKFNLTANYLHEMTYDDFDLVCMQILNKHAPIKMKYIRANNSPFMTRELRKTVMLRSKMKNIFNKNNSVVAKEAYKKQRNLCTMLLRRAKNNYYKNLNPSFVSDKKKFWKTVKPFFSESKPSHENLMLIENEVIIYDDNVVAETFNEFFVNAVKNLDIEIDSRFISNTENIDDPILKSIEEYKFHPSIIKIKESLILASIL